MWQEKQAVDALAPTARLAGSPPSKPSKPQPPVAALHVEYPLTPFGARLIDILDAIDGLDLAGAFDRK